RRRHTSFSRDWSSDVCSSDLRPYGADRRDPDLPRRRPAARTSRRRQLHRDCTQGRPDGHPRFLRPRKGRPRQFKKGTGMTKIALMGAGGKMGVRLATNLMDSRFDVAPVEVAEAGRARLKAATGLDCIDQGQALSRADVVVLAVPDRMIGAVAHQIVPTLDPGTAVIVLDAAAPHAGEMPERADITYFVTHPCHPPIFNDEVTAEAKNDFFGGIAAKQHI